MLPPAPAATGRAVRDEPSDMPTIDRPHFQPARRRPARRAPPPDRARGTPAPHGERVLFATTEMADFVKAGGLGDVSSALPRALAREHDVRVLLPGYRAVVHGGRPLRIVGRTRPHHELPACAVGELRLRDGLCVLVLCNEALYERDGSPYVDAQGREWSDNDLRFATFSHAAAEIAAGRAGLSWRPDLLHLNDWPGALAACYLDWRGDRVPSVLTIHNLAYQGVFAPGCRSRLGIPERAAEFGTRRSLSFLKGGLANASHLTTVSETYARQITEPAHGCGLDAVLRKRMAEGRLTGIVNGIDASWDASRDPALWSPFAVGEWTRRRANGREVRAELGLLPGDGPLFAVVSRIVQQKGLDMICEAAPQLVAAGGQLALIGRGEPALERRTAALAQRFPGRVAYWHGFDGGLARRMFAGADFLLMPSRYEPCGLSQMYAQAYGCLPLAHATGGLRDTIEDGVTGLLFHDASVGSLRHGLQRAFRVFAEPMLLDAMRGAAMLEQHGWEEPGRRYAELYRRILPRQAAA